MTSPASGAADLPEHAPIPRPRSARPLYYQGYHVGRVERNLYWVTDGVYNSAFLATPLWPIVAVAGVSGSGKTSPAIGTLYAEGMHRSRCWCGGGGRD